MKLALAFAAILAVAYAQIGKSGQPINRASSDQTANVLRLENEIGPDGSYKYELTIDNGITAEAQGTPRDFGGNPPAVAVVSQGSFGWNSPEGNPISISYVANENGYQPSGDAIPTPHPIPEYIARAIEYVKNAPKN